MPNELQPVPVNKRVLDEFNRAYSIYVRDLDENLIINKNKQYGDSWQAHGPFVAAGRMKDKLIRTETQILQNSEVEVSQRTNPEGFQDILEIISYAKLLALYWIYNNLQNESNIKAVDGVYSEISEFFELLQEEDNRIVAGDI